jgi:hypothetical protein
MIEINLDEATWHVVRLLAYKGDLMAANFAWVAGDPLHGPVEFQPCGLASPEVEVDVSTAYEPWRCVVFFTNS